MHAIYLVTDSSKCKTTKYIPVVVQKVMFLKSTQQGLCVFAHVDPLLSSNQHSAAVLLRGSDLKRSAHLSAGPRLPPDGRRLSPARETLPGPLPSPTGRGSLPRSVGRGSLPRSAGPLRCPGPVWSSTFGLQYNWLSFDVGAGEWRDGCQMTFFVNEKLALTATCHPFLQELSSGKRDAYPCPTNCPHRLHFCISPRSPTATFLAGRLQS